MIDTLCPQSPTYKQPPPPPNKAITATVTNKATYDKLVIDTCATALFPSPPGEGFAGTLIIEIVGLGRQEFEPPHNKRDYEPLFGFVLI